MSAESLETALRSAGVRCTVEAVDRLAVIIPDNEEAERAAIRDRREALRLIGAHGFTHLALELPREPADRAPLHRD